MKIIPCGTVLVLGLLMGACTTNISPDTYSVDSVGSVTRSVPGVIVSSRPVNVEGTQKIGGVTGAVAGGVAGSAIGGGDRAHALGAIGGAVIGALAGSAIEKGITNQTGIEYVVKTADPGTGSVSCLQRWTKSDDPVRKTRPDRRAINRLGGKKLPKKRVMNRPQQPVLSVLLINTLFPTS